VGIKNVAAAMLGAVLVLGACGRADESASSPDGVAVTAGFYPLAEAADRVGGERVEVTNLTPAGAEPHDLELSTRDVDRIEDADVVLFLGRGFQPGLEEVAKRSNGTTVDLLSGIGGVDSDPHVWLDPRKMATIVERVRDTLIRVDADGAELYRTNATAYLSELTDLDDAFAGGLRTCARKVIVTSHAAFGHLAGRYGLEQQAIAGVDPDGEPDPRRLAELVTDVRSRGVTTIFSETLVSPKVAETLAREAGVGTAVLDPLEGLSDDRRKAGDDYVSVMGENLATLRAALDCE